MTTKLMMTNKSIHNFEVILYQWMRDQEVFKPDEIILLILVINIKYIIQFTYLLNHAYIMSILSVYTIKYLLSKFSLSVVCTFVWLHMCVPERRLNALLYHSLSHSLEIELGAGLVCFINSLNSIPHGTRL